MTGGAEGLALGPGLGVAATGSVTEQAERAIRRATPTSRIRNFRHFMVDLQMVNGTLG